MDDLTGEPVLALLEEHLAEMRATTPPESKHALDLDGLRAPEITFWSVWDGDDLVACGAVKRLDERHGEVKSMRVTNRRQGRGIGAALLTHIIEQARSMGLRRLSLETGSGPFFERARSLYAKFGFEYCEPFGDYKPDPLSVFMTRTL